MLGVTLLGLLQEFCFYIGYAVSSYIFFVYMGVVTLENLVRSRHDY